jgi:hypothetical protein
MERANSESSQRENSATYCLRDKAAIQPSEGAHLDSAVMGTAQEKTERKGNLYGALPSHLGKRCATAHAIDQRHTKAQAVDSPAQPQQDSPRDEHSHPPPPIKPNYAKPTTRPVHTPKQALEAPGTFDTEHPRTPAPRLASKVAASTPTTIQGICSVDDLMGKLSASIACLSFTPKPPLNLMALPQEIQDLIFDYAYPDDPNFKFIGPRECEARDMYGRFADRSTYVLRPYTGSKAGAFLVSKRYFVSASRAFVSNQIFDDSRKCHFFRPKSNSLFGNGQTGIASQFVRTLTVDFSLLQQHATSISSLPNLKSLTAAVSGFDFVILDPKLAWEDELDDTDIARMVGSVKLMSGLQEFKATTRPFNFAKTSAQQAKYQANVERLENYLSPLVTRPRIFKESHELEVQGDGRIPLYLGSKVMFEDSKAQKDPWLQTKTSSKDASARKNAASAQGPKAVAPVVTFQSAVDPQKTTSTVSNRKLALKDIPTDLTALKSLVDQEGDSVVEWIKEMQGVLLGSASEGEQGRMK